MESILVGIAAVVVIGIAGLTAWKGRMGKSVVSTLEEEEDELLEMSARGKNQTSSCLKVI